MRSLADALGPIPDGAGPIGLLSGDEFTPATEAFDRALLALSGPRVALITCADPTHAHQTEEVARARFAGLGATAAVLDPPLPDPLPDFDLLYIAGGDPGVLLRALADDPGWAGVLGRWRAGAGLAGASAGAMALCEHCLVPEPGASRPTRWSRGLGPLQNVGLAVHATTRPESWLREVTETSRSVVIALDDATGVILADRHEPVVLGPGRARICS